MNKLYQDAKNGASTGDYENEAFALDKTKNRENSGRAGRLASKRGAARARSLFVPLIAFVCLISVTLCACSGERVSWHSPMLSVSVQTDELGIYEDFDVVSLNAQLVAPATLLMSSAVTGAKLSVSYDGENSYKARINVRIDTIEVEEDGSMGHSVVEFGVSKSHAAVLFYAEQTWFDGAYGSNAASGGDTLFDERYYSSDDALFSATRRAIDFNRTSAQQLAELDFYIVGLIDGYYAINFYIEIADSHGHFHGINKLALTSFALKVGTPSYRAEQGAEHEH